MPGRRGARTALHRGGGAFAVGGGGQYADAAHSTLGGSASTVVSGAVITVTLTLRDSSDNQLPNAAGLSIVPTKSGGTATGTLSGVTDVGDGTLTWTYTGVLAGTAQTLGATINTVAVSTTNPTCAVTVGAIDRTTSTVTLSAASATEGGSNATVTLHAKDAAGNLLTAGGSTVVFSHSGGTSDITVGSTTDVGDGTYTAPVTPTTAGTATTMSATIGGQAVTTSMPTFTVTPLALFHTDWSTATGGGTSALRDTDKTIPWSSDIGSPSDFNVITKASAGGTWPSAMSNVLDMTVTTTDHSNWLYITGQYSAPTSIGEALYYRVYIKMHCASDLGGNSAHFIESKAGACASTGEILFFPKGDGTWDIKFVDAVTGDKYHCVGLPQDVVLRFEWQLVRISGTGNFNLHFRVYDDTDTLIKSDADFSKNDTGTTLANTPTIQQSESCLAGNFQIGRNGNPPAATSHIYFGAVAIGNVTWLGAYNSGSV